MTRPRLLDLFCGAGGAAMGYHRAGFEVVGVDINPQPHYPFEFHQADALSILRTMVDYPTFSGEMWRPGYFNAIHASPPCQYYANVTRWRGQPSNHADLIAATRASLQSVAGPYVIENVPEAPLRHDYVLCGSMFGIKVRRHRAFETSWGGPTDLQAPCASHHRLLPFMHKDERAYADAMGCTWMTKEEAREAIPPAYTEYVGAFLLDAVRGCAA